MSANDKKNLNGYYWTTNNVSYIKLFTLKITGTYVNTPVTFNIKGRSGKEAFVQICFSNSSSTDPTMASFTGWGAYSGYYSKLRIYKTTTSTWEIWLTSLTQSYDSGYIWNIIIPNGITFTFNGNTSTSLPSSTTYTNCTTATIIANVNGNSNTSTKWATSRNFYIQDASGSHTGSAVSVDGSTNEYLKLPSTITATLDGTASNASKLGNYSLVTSGNYYGGIPLISTNGVMEIGRYIDFHSSDTSTADFSIRLTSPAVSGVQITLPSTAGTLALTTGNVTSATKLQNARTLWGKSFNGTASISGDMTGVGTITASGELKSTNPNALRMAYNYGDYGVIFRIDQTNFYFLMTEKDNQLNGTFRTDVFPFTVNLASGDIVINKLSTNTQITQGSDIRLKDVTGNVHLTVEQIAAAPSIKFKWKKTGKQAIGSIAQYWKNILPEAVDIRDDGMLTMSYSVTAMLASITNARRIIELEKKIKEMENEIRKLKAC